MLDKDSGRWSFDEIGPGLGQKFKLAKEAAEVSGEFAKKTQIYFRESEIAKNIGMSPFSLSHAKAGKKRKDGSREYVHAQHLIKLAQYFGMDRVGRLGASAWQLFKPDVSVEEFERVLRRVGYGHVGATGGHARRPADAFLEWLSDNCDFSRLGIEVVHGREVPRRGDHTERAAGIVDEMTEEIENSAVRFGAGDDIMVRIAPGPSTHVVLLQLSDIDHAPHFALYCVAPSYRHRATVLPPDGLIPMSPDNKGRRGFKLGEDKGRIDILALVTEQRPLSLPFTPPLDPRYRMIEPMDELRLLKGILADRASGVRVLHVPIRVG